MATPIASTLPISWTRSRSITRNRILVRPKNGIVEDETLSEGGGERRELRRNRRKQVTASRTQGCQLMNRIIRNFQNLLRWGWARFILLAEVSGCLPFVVRIQLVFIVFLGAIQSLLLLLKIMNEFSQTGITFLKHIVISGNPKKRRKWFVAFALNFLCLSFYLAFA
jgi:hypothetical protein